MLEELVPLVRAGDQPAKERLLKLSMGRIKYHALRYGPDLFDDMIQEGVIGLLRAVDLYEPIHNCSFIHYASWHITARMRRFRKLQRLIRIPEKKVVEHNFVDYEPETWDPEPLDRIPLEMLSAREQLILQMRFYENLTLRQVGSKLGVTYNAVHLIERKALKKLRLAMDTSHPTDS